VVHDELLIRRVIDTVKLTSGRLLRQIDSVKTGLEDLFVTASTAPDARDSLLTAARAELVEHGHAGISLRAVARRAGLSHAAPKHHFDDRAGLLTAVATEGFQALTAELRQVTETTPAGRLAALGRAYIDFGLANPALFDLMFRPVELHPDDPALHQAQQDAIGLLGAAAVDLTPLAAGDLDPRSLTLLSWALVHGLVVLTRDGALQDEAHPGDALAAAALARYLAAAFTSYAAQAPED
jgi:AcrR family transcriptional regulator